MVTRPNLTRRTLCDAPDAALPVCTAARSRSGGAAARAPCRPRPVTRQGWTCLRRSTWTPTGPTRRRACPRTSCKAALPPGAWRPSTDTITGHRPDSPARDFPQRGRARDRIYAYQATFLHPAERTDTFAAAALVRVMVKYMVMFAHHEGAALSRGRRRQRVKNIPSTVPTSGVARARVLALWRRFSCRTCTDMVPVLDDGASFSRSDCTNRLAAACLPYRARVAAAVARCRRAARPCPCPFRLDAFGCLADTSAVSHGLPGTSDTCSCSGVAAGCVSGAWRWWSRALLLGAAARDVYALHGDLVACVNSPVSMDSNALATFVVVGARHGYSRPTLLVAVDRFAPSPAKRVSAERASLGTRPRRCRRARVPVRRGSRPPSSSRRATYGCGERRRMPPSCCSARIRSRRAVRPGPLPGASLMRHDGGRRQRSRPPRRRRWLPVRQPSPARS